MRDEEFGVIGTWSLGILLFIATMIVIHWTIGFVTWSTLDSGWAQAIGSIGALGVAIYVMSRQNAHSLRVMALSERLGTMRRADAVLGIVEPTHARIAEISNTISTRSTRDPLDLQKRRVRMLLTKVQRLEDTIRAIPVHDLGAYDIAKAGNQIAQFISQYTEAMAEMDSYEELMFGTKRMELDILAGLISGSLHSLRHSIEKERDSFNDL